MPIELQLNTLPKQPPTSPWLDRLAGRTLVLLRRRPSVFLVAYGLQFACLMLAWRGPVWLKLSLAVVLLGWVLGFLLVLRQTFKLSRRLSVAFFHGDADEVARLRVMIDGSGAPHSEHEHQGRLVGHAEELLLRERWAEAAELLNAVKREGLPPLARPGVLSELGYATALAGRAAHGVSLAERALEEAAALPGYPEPRRWYLEKRLGVALAVAHRHLEAVTTLGAVLERSGGSDHERASAAYHLAQAYRALGALEFSTQVLKLAARLSGPCAVRAQAALTAQGIEPHSQQPFARA